MLSIQSIKDSFSRYVIRIGRSRLRQQLLLRDDRFLADTGFSRTLLEQGIDAWPWRTEKAKNDAKTNVSILREHERRQAIAELHAYSDRELSDLGLTRGQIVQAVSNGRPEIDSQNKDWQRAA